MPYCTHCGCSIPTDATFCQNCGTRVGTVQASGYNQRTTVYDGNIHKCPNCGEVLASFMRNCPACGMEIRDARINSVILDFIAQLNIAEQELSASGGLYNSSHKEVAENKKINIIRNFPVPNTAEAMLEFMVLATSNIDIAAYVSDKKPLSDAWLSKIEQIYKKAQLSTGTIETKQKITDLYNDCILKIKKEKRSKKLKPVLIRLGIFGGPLLLLILIGALMNFTNILIANRQNDQLIALSKEIEICISNHEYVDALIKLNDLVYKPQGEEPSEKDKELMKEWARKRTSYIRQLETAADEKLFCINSPITPSQALGQNADELKRTFESYGFVNVTVMNKTDLLSDSLELDGVVSQISINNSEDFTQSSTFAFTDPVIITSHSVLYVNAPGSSQHYKGKDINDVKETFVAAGFRNIRVLNVESLEVESTVLNGKVVEISINGENDFYSKTKYVADAKVIILYK